MKEVRGLGWFGKLLPLSSKSVSFGMAVLKVLNFFFYSNEKISLHSFHTVKKSVRMVYSATSVCIFYNKKGLNKCLLFCPVTWICMVMIMRGSKGEMRTETPIQILKIINLLDNTVIQIIGNKASPTPSPSPLANIIFLLTPPSPQKKFGSAHVNKH